MRPGVERSCSTPPEDGASWSSTFLAGFTWTPSTTRSPPSIRNSAPVRSATSADAIVLDLHAEATSEKMAMGHFCDGRASLVVGTHTHVPTADAQILVGGTAYQTDAGACADYDSVIGNQKEEPLRRFTTRISGGRYKPAEGPATVCGVLVVTDDSTGLAKSIEPIRVGGRLAAAIPADHRAA